MTEANDALSTMGAEQVQSMGSNETPSALSESGGEDAGQPASAPPPSGLAMIARLKAEAEASDDAGRKAVLLHEAAELEERTAGDELGAAREYLAAYNQDANFREPLEALLRILERRRSLKNLGRVLESLSKSADLPEERARALRARASHAVDVANDVAQGRAFLEEAVEADPADATSWLFLELEAGARSDAEARKNALSRRVELANDPRWASLLRVDLSELRAADGDVDDALDVLTEVVSSPGEEAWRACELAERVARQAERGDREAWALSQRGEIVLESLQEPLGPRGAGVPKSLRQRGVAADAFVRAAASYRGVGRIEDELQILERAIEIDPAATMPYLARIAAASRLGDLERAGRLARELADRGVRPELSPLLWFTVAEAALARGDRAQVIEACEKLLGPPAEPTPTPSPAAEGAEGAEAVAPAAAPVALAAARALVPKTLLADLLLDGSDPARLGALLEADAAARTTDDGKARGFLVTATVYGVIARDGEAARGALAKAVAAGADARLVARLGRALASCTPSGEGDAKKPDDAAWYEAATSKLQAAAKEPAEAADVALDLARARLAHGDREGARSALESIADGAPHLVLARVLRLALGGDGAGDGLLAELSAGAEGDPAVSFAVARAVRAARGAPPENEAARTAAIEAIAKASETDEVALLARAAAALEARPADAAQVLLELSKTLGEPGARDVARIGASLLQARAGNLAGAIENTADLETEAGQALAPARAVWARLLAKGAPEERRAAMDSMSRELFARTAWSPLERLADRLASSQSDGEVTTDDLFAALGDADEPALVRAGLFLRAGWPDPNLPADAKDDALRSIELLGDDAARLVARAALRRAGADNDPAQAAIAATAWHAAGGGVPAALELLIAAEQSADSDAEVRGRTALAGALTGAAGHLLAASASMAAHVVGLEPPPLPVVVEGEGVAPIALAAFELAPPGCDPSRREAALRGLSEVVESGAHTLLEMAAWSALVRADHAAARALFARSIELAKETGEEPRSAIEGAVETELAAAGGRPTVAWAELAERLAKATEDAGDVPAAAELWEQIGHAWWDALGNTQRGEAALLQAFQRDNHRQKAFDRVFRAMRARKEDDSLLAVIARRLEATDNPPEMAKLFWEQARVLRAKGDRDGALNSLENVTMLEPDHVGALALSAEIYIGRQQYEEAAMALDRLSRQNVPVQQKLGAGLGAADLYEQRIGKSDKALDVLVALDHAGISDIAIHERIARAAAKAEAWIPATAYLEKLIHERTDANGRIEAARLAAAIFRDKLDDPQGAVPALVALLREAPDDMEALEQLLDAGPTSQAARETLVRSLAVTRLLLGQSPSEARSARVAARLAALLGELDLQQLALGVLGVVDEGTPKEKQAEQALVARLGSAPAVALDDAGMRRLSWPDEAGPILDLFRIMAPTIAEAIGPTLDALGVGRRERIDARAGHPLRNEIAAWAGALGIAEFELYYGGKDPRVIQGVPGEVPAIVVGNGNQTPLDLEQRARLVRELVALRKGTTAVLSRDDVTVAAIVVASCAQVDVVLKTPPYAVLAETQRLIGKAIARKTKKLLPDVANAIAQKVAGGFDPRTFRAAALRTLDRAALLATGDPAAALADILGPGASAAKVTGDQRAQALLRFLWSDDYLALRRQLGLGIG
jgi:tetratricopeptide (TPR) repeat protein